MHYEFLFYLYSAMLHNRITDTQESHLVSLIQPCFDLFDSLFAFDCWFLNVRHPEGYVLGKNLPTYCRFSKDSLQNCINILKLLGNTETTKGIS